MYISVSVLFIFPPLFHGPEQIYSYPIQNSEVQHYLCESVTALISVTMSTWKIWHGVKIGFHNRIFSNSDTLMDNFSL